MAITKSASTLASGVTSSSTTSSVNTSTYNGATVYGTITVVGTASMAASVQVQESPDGSTWYNPPTKLFTAGTAAAIYPFEIAADPTAQAIQLVFSAQSGGTSSTLNAQLGSVSE